MSLPFLHFSTIDQPEEPAYETWRRLMAPMYDILPFSRGGRHPGGSTIAYLLGDILANRTQFSAQHITRDRRRVDGTPDHLVFQLWRKGGYAGEIAAAPIAYGAGTVTFSDRRRTLAGRFAPADTVGIVVPRALLSGIDLEARSVRFDPARNRLLQARLVALYRELPQTQPEAVGALRNELVGFLRRILDPSTASDVLEGLDLHRGLFALAERFILTHLGSPDLSPATIAAGLGISRATLYRVFASHGGVMQCVQERRLQAVRDALADPLERRSLTSLATVHGLGSLAHLSRSFRARYGVAPSEWRRQCRADAARHAQVEPDRFWHWFNGLGAMPRVTGSHPNHSTARSNLPSRLAPA